MQKPKNCKSGEEEDEQGLEQTADVKRKVVALNIAVICAHSTL